MMSIDDDMNDLSAFQGDATEDGNMRLDFELDPTVNGLDPSMASTADGQDPTLISTNTRKPRVKLTAEKLLSTKGLPYVMEHAPKSCRISKHKTAYDNLTNFLQFYQLWAHNLYPKAKFKDFTSLCESLGKTDKELREYRMNLVRKDMGIVLGDDITNVPDIQMHDTGVPPARQGQDGLFVTDESTSTTDRGNAQHGYEATKTVSRDKDKSQDNDGNYDDDDDVLYSSHLQRHTNEMLSTTDTNIRQQTQKGSALPNAEELDELSKITTVTSTTNNGDDIASDEEMAMMRDMDTS
ncbi:Csm3 [Kluyveromyces lactis]|nr:Csm3 [Kluyveromyces lactis]